MHRLYMIGEQFKVILTFGKQKIKIIHTVENDVVNDQWRIKEYYYQHEYKDLGYPTMVSAYYISDLNKSFPNRKK